MPVIPCKSDFRATRAISTSLVIALAAIAGCTPERGDDRSVGKDRIEIVQQYADNVLEYGRDQWSGMNTPLLVDGINVDTREPVYWRYNGEEFIVSNLASQQNLFRFLTGLSNLTGDPKYKDAAKSSIQYHFDHLISSCGLLHWGGHQIIDLKTVKPTGKFYGDSHELKNSFPFYELMHEVDEKATARYLRAFWNAHIKDWKTLDMNRHGPYGLEMGDLWDNEFGYPHPFYEGDGLSFINTGTDLIFAAGMLHAFGGDPAARTWAERLAGLYVQARHPETGLGAYQYSKPRQLKEPVIPMTRDIHTWAHYGDRARNQFSPEYGEVAREGWALWGNRVRSIYVRNAMVMLGMAELLDDDGKLFLDWTVDGLKALAEQVYIPESNIFRPMWADGTDLTGHLMPRKGYYGDKGDKFAAQKADLEFLMTFARAYRLSGEKILWETAKQMARGLGLGDIGHPDGVPRLNMDLNDPHYEGPSPEEIFTLLELYRSNEHPAFLERAEMVADRLIKERFRYGFFLPGPDYIHANFNTLEPFAIITLEATLRGHTDTVPMHVGSRGYIHGRFDGFGNTRDHIAIWSRKRE
jgi:pectate lyase